jgi:hypothetical protein
MTQNNLETLTPAQAASLASTDQTTLHGKACAQSLRIIDQLTSALAEARAERTEERAERAEQVDARFVAEAQLAAANALLEYSRSGEGPWRSDEEYHRVRDAHLSSQSAAPVIPLIVGRKVLESGDGATITGVSVSPATAAALRVPAAPDPRDAEIDR